MMKNLPDQKEIWEDYGLRKELIYNRNPERDLIKLVDFLKSQNVKDILDLGCGEGRNLRFLLDKGFDAVGMDISEGALRKCSELLNIPVSALKIGNIYSIPEESGSFDCVMLFDLFHHLEKPTQALTEIKRILRPSSYLIANTLSMADFSFGLGEQVGTNSFVENGLYSRYYSQKSLSELLKRNQFTPIEIRESQREDPPHDGLLESRKEPHIHNYFFVLARKVIN